MLVALRTLHMAGTRKLKARFVGPFRVVERIGKTAYRVDLRGRFKGVHNVFYMSQLNRHSPGGSSTSPPETVQVEGGEHFKVEALL